MENVMKLWVDKYRPDTTKGFVFNAEGHKQIIDDYIERGSFPNLMLEGVQGTGKTTLARLLINACNVDPADVLELHASDQNGVDTMRDEIKSFITTFPIGAFKVVLFEEADGLTPKAQDILRKFTEDYADNVRYIFTCNKSHKIIAPIHSRCKTFTFKACDVDTATSLVAQILVNEKIKFKLETLDAYVTAFHPDLRKLIHELQAHSVGGKLLPLEEVDNSVSAEIENETLHLIANDQWDRLRKFLCENVDRDGWEQVYRLMYENLHTSQKFSNIEKWEEGIVIIAEHLYKDSSVSDREINMAAAIIRLKQV